MESSATFRRFDHAPPLLVKEETILLPETTAAASEKPLAKADNTKLPSPKREDLNSSSVQLPAISKMESSSASEPDPRASSSSRRDQIESAKAEMGEAREENQRLRMYLDKIMKDYKTLETQFLDILRQEAQESTEKSGSEEPEFVSLTLGRASKQKINTKGQEDEEAAVKGGGLSLGLDCKFELAEVIGPSEVLSVLNSSPEDSYGGPKEDAAGEDKILKTMRTGDDEESSQQIPAKRARVSVRARCDTPTMNDGCQWRKYGQKIAKGNPCPRAYYRCTVAQSCPVRKQVQRCAEDMTILITTYEGEHNHPLPYAATAMASTTSAAASMLLSGSSTSAAATATNPDLHGLNFYLSDTSRSKQFYFPNSSLSAASSNPTITLDLTTSTSSSTPSHFNRFSSSYPPPRFPPTTTFNFTSSKSNAPAAPTLTPASWSGSGVLNYGIATQPYNSNNRNHTVETLNSIPPLHIQKSNPADPIAAATKAIASDPSFQSALAAALTSIMAANGGGNHPGGDQAAFGQKLKWRTSSGSSSGGEAALSIFQSSSNVSKGMVNNNGCASNYMINKSPPPNSRPAGSLMFLPPPMLPFSASSKNAAASPADNINRDHTS